MPAPNLSLQELARLRTKKVWEKVIGAKFNVNDELNHIAAQAALYNLGQTMLSGTTSTGKKYQK